MGTPKQPMYGYLMMKEAYQDKRREWRSGGLQQFMVYQILLFVGGWQITKLGTLNEEVHFFRAQDEMLAEHCVSMAHLGYGFTTFQIIDTAKNMCEAIGKDIEPTKHWFYGFLKGFPDLKMVKPKKGKKRGMTL